MPEQLGGAFGSTFYFFRERERASGETKDAISSKCLFVPTPPSEGVAPKRIFVQDANHKKSPNAACCASIFRRKKNIPLQRQRFSGRKPIRHGQLQGLARPCAGFRVPIKRQTGGERKCSSGAARQPANSTQHRQPALNHFVGSCWVYF